MKNDNFFVNEEPFFDHEMITLYTKMTDDINQMLIKGMFETSLKVGYIIEEERLKKWIERCVKLDNINEYTVNDIAIEKKFRQLKNKIDYLKNRPDTKWQELKEWCKNQIIDLRHIDIKTKDQNLRVNDGVNCFREVLRKMQELEGEDDE